MREREDDIASVSFDSMSHTHTHFLSVITVGTSLVYWRMIIYCLKEEAAFIGDMLA